MLYIFKSRPSSNNYRPLRHCGVVVFARNRNIQNLSKYDYNATKKCIYTRIPVRSDIRLKITNFYSIFSVTGHVLGIYLFVSPVE